MNGKQIFKVIGLTFFALAVFTIFGLVLWKIPQWQVRQLPFDKERIELENKIRDTLARTLGSAVLLAGLYFTWRNLVSTQEKQITERFTKAIEQLSSKELAIRLGGIYGLERIARDSPKDHWTIRLVRKINS